MESSISNNYLALIGLMAIWELVWKGQALWRAAQRGEKGWYVVMLIVNTVGILPILYLYVFSQKPAKHTGKKAS